MRFFPFDKLRVRMTGFCHPEPFLCHPEPFLCHPERGEGSLLEILPLRQAQGQNDRSLSCPEIH